MIPYTKKYQPVNCKDIVGQDKPLKELSLFITDFKAQKKKASLVYGPPGVGKTCCAYTLAKELDLEIIEVNASEFRNKEQINLKIGGAVNQQSLFSKGKLILVDEIDGLSGQKDRGGIQSITKLIEKSSFPMILTATNPWGNKFNTLRRKCNLLNSSPWITFQSLRY